MNAELESRVRVLEEKIRELSSPKLLKYKKLVPEARLYKKHEDDSCWDVFATSVSHEGGYIEYGTGLQFDIPKGCELKAYARSSVSTSPLILANGVGVIDEGFKGELMFRFKCFPNVNTRRYDVGDRIGQIQLVKKIPSIAQEVSSISDSSRGSKGFGSTGNK